MEEFNYDLQLKAARKAAKGLKQRLEGKKLQKKIFDRQTKIKEFIN